MATVEPREGRPAPAGPSRPRIGVAGKDPAQLNDYLEAVRAAGGEPIPLLPDGDRSADALLDGLDGLVLTGGRDIDPGHYGEALREGLGVDVDEPRDALEIPLARGALERDLPILGICRGIQVLNVAAGGTLLQDVTLAGIASGTHNQREATPRPADHAGVHEVVIAPESRLAEIVGETRVGVNTFHHQVIDDLAPQFTIVARSVEARGAGLIEAVEAKGRRFLLGVQWHPERMWRRVPAWARLFQAFVAAAARKPAG